MGFNHPQVKLLTITFQRELFNKKQKSTTQQQKINRVITKSK
jgi:hypothetical protein